MIKSTQYFITFLRILLSLPTLAVAAVPIAILLAAVIGGKIQGADFSLMGKVLKDTCRQMWKTVVTIMSIMAMAKIMSHSGMIAEIAGMMVALTGSFYPAAAPFVGAIGTFVTGSGTSANVLVGGQVIVGRIKGIQRPPLAPLIPTERGVSLLIS